MSDLVVELRDGCRCGGICLRCRAATEIERSWAENAAAAQAAFEVTVTWQGRAQRAEERLGAIVAWLMPRVPEETGAEVAHLAGYARCEQCGGTGEIHWRGEVVDEEGDTWGIGGREPCDCINGWRPSDE